MKKVVADKSLIAYCGLYCAACGKYLKGKCPGCHENVKATWCKVRTCCMEHSFNSCTDCTIVQNLKDCRKLNNFIAKLFALVFRSDRFACLAEIKEKGYDIYAKEMAEKEIVSIKK